MPHAVLSRPRLLFVAVVLSIAGLAAAFTGVADPPVKLAAAESTPRDVAPTTTSTVAPTTTTSTTEVPTTTTTAAVPRVATTAAPTTTTIGRVRRSRVPGDSSVPQVGVVPCTFGADYEPYEDGLVVWADVTIPAAPNTYPMINVFTPAESTALAEPVLMGTYATKTDASGASTQSVGFFLPSASFGDTILFKASFPQGSCEPFSTTIGG